MSTRRLLSLIAMSWLVIGIPFAANAQSSAQASSSSSVGNGAPAYASLGEFVVPLGAQLALELVRSEPCRCLCDPIVVSRWSLVASGGDVLQESRPDSPIAIAEWLGRVALIDDLGQALPEALYTVQVETSIGTFEAMIRPNSEPPQGTFRASASICDLSLVVYRLVDESHAGTAIDLRVGDRLMVVLPGNPTTGYQWANTLLYEYAVLLPSAEPEYRPTSMASGMVGAGGLFLFRYEARDVGSQSFRFLYARPWESSDSDRVLEFSVHVR